MERNPKLKKTKFVRFLEQDIGVLEQMRANYESCLAESPEDPLVVRAIAVTKQDLKDKQQLIVDHLASLDLWVP